MDKVNLFTTSEMMLRVFTGLTLVLFDEGTQMQTHLTALTPVQRRILELLDLPLEIYTRLRRNHWRKIDVLRQILALSG